MLTEKPILIAEDNLSYAWARIFHFALISPKASFCPLLISIGGFTDNHPAEDEQIRHALDNSLAEQGRYSTSVSASVIFPYKEWTRTGRPPAEKFFHWYLEDLLPRLKARDRLNRNGTYFERMIAFHGLRPKNGKLAAFTKNQLEQIISQWNRDRNKGRRPRQSALQVACFDPPKDHTGQPMRGFPCLQQVGFTYDDIGGLSVNAFYPTQYIFDRAYGNYLGLCHLGHFMAHELGVNLVRVNVFITCPELGSSTKYSLIGLRKIVQEFIENGTIPRN